MTTRSDDTCALIPSFQPVRSADESPSWSAQNHVGLAHALLVELAKAGKLEGQVETAKEKMKERREKKRQKREQGMDVDEDED